MVVSVLVASFALLAVTVTVGCLVLSVVVLPAGKVTSMRMSLLAPAAMVPVSTVPSLSVSVRTAPLASRMRTVAPAGRLRLAAVMSKVSVRLPVLVIVLVKVTLVVVLVAGAVEVSFSSAMVMPVVVVVSVVPAGALPAA